MKPRLPQLPQNAQAVHEWKHDIEQNNVDVGRQTEFQSSISIIGERHGMPLSLERPAEQIGGIRSIFGYQDSNILILPAHC